MADHTANDARHVAKMCNVSGCNIEASYWIDTSEGFAEPLLESASPSTFYLCLDHQYELDGKDGNGYAHLRIDTGELPGLKSASTAVPRIATCAATCDGAPLGGLLCQSQNSIASDTAAALVRNPDAGRSNAKLDQPLPRTTMLPGVREGRQPTVPLHPPRRRLALSNSSFRGGRSLRFLLNRPR